MSDFPTQGISDTDHGEPTFDRARAAMHESRLSQIGPYHILELLGSGGMGEVYKAEQRSPIRRTVAIKIIKLGYDSREVIARFESERQALARMDHPNIAKVLDAGVTETGQPYFVMEYVPGVPITKFCDDNKLSIKDRLLLFTQGCDAIAHAHTKAIIHRDIKAGNVLAFLHDGNPTVKVIDFGIAKALTGDRLTDATFNTERGQMIGTYEYMSPEQAEGSPDIDTRTDVYSLGVLLYELLTGAKPFDHETLAKAGENGVRRIIREVEPMRPSTRLSQLGAGANTIASVRQLRPEGLVHQLRIELEWVPLKAMRKERSRRYASPIQLRDDIQNYILGRALMAAPEDRIYRLRKLIARHLIGITSGLAIIASLVIFVALYIHGISAEQGRTANALVDANVRRAEAEAANTGLRAANDFLVDLLSAPRGRLAAAKVVTVEDMLNWAEGHAADRLGKVPLVEASIRITLGITYQEMGRWDQALPQLREGLAIRRRVLGQRHRQTIEATNSLSYALTFAGDSQEGKQLASIALEMSSSSLGTDDKETWASRSNLAFACNALREYAEAERLHRDMLAWKRRTFGDDAIETVWEMNSLAWVFQCSGKLGQAEATRRDALETCRRTVGERHPETFISAWGLARVVRAEGRNHDAAALLRNASELGNSLRDDDPDRWLCRIELAEVLLLCGATAEAESVARDVARRLSPAIVSANSEIRRGATILGEVLNTVGQGAAATELRTKLRLPDGSKPVVAPATRHSNY